MPRVCVTRPNARQTPVRLSTGVRGLDEILSGGFIHGSTCVVQGAPGTGKTVLSNQIAFHRTGLGAQVVYMTLLAESHGRLLQHLRSFAFFDESAVGDRLIYLSGYQELEDSPPALLGMLQREVFARRPELVVLDGITSVQELHGTLALRQFIHALQVFAEGAGTTALLLSANPQTPSPEDTIVDGIVYLSEEQRGLGMARELRVHKMRGSTHLPGRHLFTIDERGVGAFPRLEALYHQPSRRIEYDAARLTFDDPGIDDMMGGGIPAASSTIVLGPTGSGKTLLGLSFLAAGLGRGETALYHGFYEAPVRLLAAGESIGLRLRPHAETGRFQIDWDTPVELTLDTWGHRLLNSVEQNRPTRLFIDGINAMQESAMHRERLAVFLTALLNELRSRGVTTILSAEMHPVFGAGIHVPSPGLSPLVENTILLRYVELRSRLYRLVSVLKVRGSAHQTAMREFRIDGDGLHVASTFESAETILTGSAHDTSGRRRGEPDDG